MSRDKKDLHSELVTAYEKACDEYKKLYPTFPQPFLTCTNRTNEEQELLYAQGRTAPGKIITNARAGQSPHNYLPSMAFDVAFIGLDRQLYWQEKYFKYFSECIHSVSDAVEWGGSWNFVDNPHFQLKSWATFKNTKHL